MNNAQKIQSLILELLEASNGIARTIDWIHMEIRVAGYSAQGLRDELDILESRGLIASAPDGLGVRRWTLTEAGQEQALAL